MRAFYYVFIFFFYFFFNVICQDVYEDITNEEEVLKLIKLCDVCTCSEIPDIDGTQIVLYIQCSEFDRIENVADLDKISWPLNPNGLKISATFDGLGLSTLGKLPPNSQVETLKFTNNAINSYWPDPFSDVPNLKILSFSHNDLNEITPDLFTNIEGLEDLDLSNNKLTEFTKLDFKNLRQVKKFNLQNNDLKKIPIDALHPMVRLEDLDLSKNGIFDLLLQRSDVENLGRLKRLNLNDNKIRSIMKDTFPENNSLELLDLSNNVIEIVEENAFLTCTSLRELNLAQNNITFVFALPPTLQIAILKVNTLYHWPKFPNGIKYVDLSYNRLSDVYDDASSNFDSLEVLIIGGNQIKDLNIEKKLSNLYILDLSYNQLTTIPKTISTQYFPNLEELHFDGNPVESVYFKNIIALKSLYMNEIKTLSVIEEKAFSNVVGRFTNESESLNELNCFALYMSNCPALSEIRAGAFDGTSLCTLDLSRNNLTYLSKSLLDWSAVIEGVNLQFNPWHCSCDMQWVVDDLLPQIYATKNSRLLAELRCGSPRAFEGLRLVHWYNWTEQALCSDVFRNGMHGNYMLEPSTEKGPQVTYITLILGSCIIIALLIAIALSVYLVKTRQKYRIRQAAMKRKRQSTIDMQNGNKEQFSTLNKV